MKVIETEFFTIELSEGGTGSITSKWKESCPYCGWFDCELSCDSFKGTPEGEQEEALDRIAFNHRIDGIESLILAHACAGVDVCSEAYLEALDTAVDAIQNNS